MPPSDAQAAIAITIIRPAERAIPAIPAILPN
jgi:hypothetical protein